VHHTQKMRHRIATPAAAGPVMTQARTRGSAALAALRGESAPVPPRRMRSPLLRGRRTPTQQRRWPKAALLVTGLGGIVAAAGAARKGRADKWEPLTPAEPTAGPTARPVTGPSA